MKRLWPAALTAIAILIGMAPGSAAAALPEGPAAQDLPGRWLPAPTIVPWQWQLQGKIDTSVPADVYELDGFDVPAEVVDTLHADGRKVICYLSAGSWEDWRPDAEDFPREVLGKRYEGYPSERWLDIRKVDKLAPILEKRFAMCAEKGFDAVEADNVNGWDVRTGFPLTRADQLRFNRWVAQRVHEHGMSVALKNDGPQAKQLVGDFDMAVVESCLRYRECGDYRAFITAGKAVFAAEYEIEPFLRADAQARLQRDPQEPRPARKALAPLLNDACWQMVAWDPPRPIVAPRHRDLKVSRERARATSGARWPC